MDIVVVYNWNVCVNVDWMLFFDRCCVIIDGDNVYVSLNWEFYCGFLGKYVNLVIFFSVLLLVIILFLFVIWLLWFENLVVVKLFFEVLIILIVVNLCGVEWYWFCM